MSKRKKETVLATAKDILCEKLDVPMSVVDDLSYMEMLGNKKVVLDGCKGVLDYNDTAVRLLLSNGTILFYGDDLRFNALSNGQAVIAGTIMTIEFG